MFPKRPGCHKGSDVAGGREGTEAQERWPFGLPQQMDRWWLVVFTMGFWTMANWLVQNIMNIWWIWQQTTKPVINQPFNPNCPPKGFVAKKHQQAVVRAHHVTEGLGSFWAWFGWGSSYGCFLLGQPSIRVGTHKFALSCLKENNRLLLRWESELARTLFCPADCYRRKTKTLGMQKN